MSEVKNVTMFSGRSLGAADMHHERMYRALCQLGLRHGHLGKTDISHPVTSIW